MAIISAMQTNFLIIAFEIVFIIFFFTRIEYKDSAHAFNSKNLTKDGVDDVENFYPLFQDVHVMILVGFGFLMTFLKRYGFSSVGYNFLISAFVIQLSIMVSAVIEIIDSGHHYAKLGLESMLIADFSCATVLITMGALLGKISIFQLLVVALFETIFFKINEYIGLEILHASDVGGSMFVHTFGAYFGLAASFVLQSEKARDGPPSEGSVYHSDLFSMIGTLFLWMFWPSFNSALASKDERQRAIINTYLSLAASCCVTFAMSSFVDWISKKGSKQDASDRFELNPKFDMVHVQNATLAGGVAVGTVADMMIHPGGALTVGSVAAVLSVLGFKYITPMLNRYLRVHDTCGVNNLHGMPGVMAGIAGIIAAATASPEVYGESLQHVFGQVASYDVSSAITAAPGATAVVDITEEPSKRSVSEQALFQFYALLLTLGFSIVTGLLTGLLVKFTCCAPLHDDALHEDKEAWEVPPFHPVCSESIIYVDDTELKETIGARESELKQLHSPSA